MKYGGFLLKYRYVAKETAVVVDGFHTTNRERPSAQRFTHEFHVAPSVRRSSPSSAEISSRRKLPTSLHAHTAHRLVYTSSVFYAANNDHQISICYSGTIVELALVTKGLCGAAMRGLIQTH